MEEFKIARPTVKLQTLFRTIHNMIGGIIIEKDIWQAFYYGSSIDLTHIGLTGSSKSWVTPSHVKNSSIMTYITSFSSL